MRKTFSVLLSLIILLSSLNFSLSAHYCGQTIIDVALFGEAEACLMAMEKDCKSDEMSCCADRDLIIEGEDYVSTINFENLRLDKIKVLTAVLEFPMILPNEEHLSTPFIKEHYSPPLIEQKSHVLFQPFLL